MVGCGITNEFNAPGMVDMEMEDEWKLDNFRASKRERILTLMWLFSFALNY